MFNFVCVPFLLTADERSCYYHPHYYCISFYVNIFSRVIPSYCGDGQNLL